MRRAITAHGHRRELFVAAKRPALAAMLALGLSLTGLQVLQAGAGVTSAALPGYPTNPLGDSFQEGFTSRELNKDVLQVLEGYALWDSWLDGSKVSLRRGRLRLPMNARDRRRGMLKVGGVGSTAFYSYGRFTVRARSNPARGTIGALYLYNEDRDRLVGGRHEEIDVELSSKFPGKASLVTFHDDDWTNDDAQNDMHRGGIENIQAVPGLRNFDSRKFNTYVIDWRPNGVTWHVNGIEVEKFTAAVPTTPMQIQLDTYHNRQWNFMHSRPSGSGAMEVDYVRYEVASP